MPKALQIEYYYYYYYYKETVVIRKNIVMYKADRKLHRMFCSTGTAPTQSALPDAVAYVTINIVLKL